MTHTFTVTVHGCTSHQAEHVMRERITPEGDYVFNYTIDYTEDTS